MNLTATLLAQLVVFFILAWFTMRFIWPPLRKALDERAARVASAMKAAEQGKEELVLADERVKVTATAAQEDARKLLADYDRRVQTIIEEARHVADKEAQRIVISARMEADQLLERALTQLRGQVAGIAVGGAEQILKREVDTTENARLLMQLKHEI